jgi:ubiquinol-cytochrome c reductase cytochrome b subunit
MWWSGLVLLLMMMATAFLGYLLPWGQMSYWGAQVITNLFRAVPVVGDGLALWLRGDYVVGDATLNRFFTLHYLVPFLIVALVVIHLVALHHVKSSNPSGLEPGPRDTIPFHPYFTAKDFFGLGVFLLALCGVVFFAPDFFAEPVNNVPANPMQTPVHIEPEWYFLPFYAVLRAVPDKLGGVAAMALSILIFAALPYLDRSRLPGGARFRPAYRLGFFLFIADVAALGWIGAHPPAGALVIAGRVATVVYFALFLLLPWVSRLEERRLRVRGLPPALQAQLDREERT